MFFPKGFLLHLKSLSTYLQMVSKIPPKPPPIPPTQGVNTGVRHCWRSCLWGRPLYSSLFHECFVKLPEKRFKGFKGVNGGYTFRGCWTCCWGSFFNICSLDRVVLYIVFMVFLPFPNPGQNHSQKSCQTPGQKSGQHLTNTSSDKLTEHCTKDTLNTSNKPPWSSSPKLEIANKPVGIFYGSS